MKALLQKILSPAFIFVICQAGVGFIHYMYQIFANQYLGLAPFGSWSVWLAQLSITLLMATWLQSLAALDGQAQPLFRRYFRARIAWGLLILSVAVAVIAQYLESWIAVGAIGWFWACWQGIVFGRSLARGRLVLISVVMTVAAVCKIAIPAAAVLLQASPEILQNAFYAGVLWGPLAGLVIAIIFDLEKSGPHSLKPAGDLQIKVFMTSLLLAIVTAAAPQFDLLVAGHLLNADDLGRFGRVALVYKAFFFLILIFAQLLLSKQMQSGGGVLQPQKFLPVVGIGIAIAAVSYFVFPPHIAPTIWVALGVLHISTLTFLFLSVQTEVSGGRWRWGTLVVGLWILQFSMAWILTPTLEQFYTGALLTDALLITFLVVRAMTSKRGD